ncbi:MAG: TRAP transporter small permease [Planctomycetota bacterium]|jgi:TRAP-type C4-dicarboxylate transport system permease small subunit
MTEKDSRLRRFDKGLLTAIRIGVAVLLFLMFVVIIWEVVARHVLERPAFWTEEFARYVMFYMVLVGSSVAIRQQVHPALHLIISRFGPRVRFVWRLLIDVLVFLVLIVILVYGFEMAREEWIGRTPALRVRYFWIFLALPVGALLMMVQMVAKYALGKQEADEVGEEFFE